MRSPKNNLIAGPQSGLLRILRLAAWHMRPVDATPVETKPASITYVTEEVRRAA